MIKKLFYTSIFFLACLFIFSPQQANAVNYYCGCTVYTILDFNAFTAAGGQCSTKTAKETPMLLDIGQSMTESGTGANYTLEKNVCDNQLPMKIFGPANINKTWCAFGADGKIISTCSVQLCNSQKKTCEEPGKYCSQYDKVPYACNDDKSCEWHKTQEKCLPADLVPVSEQVKPEIDVPPPAPDVDVDAQQKAYTDAFKNSINEKYPAPEGSNFLPDCAYPGTCDDVNDLLILLINVAKFLFKIIGTAAFAFFIYGGFTMVLSMGNSDRVSHGRDTLVAAVVGLIIAFSAYLLVDVVLDVLRVSDDYRNVGTLNVESKK